MTDFYSQCETALMTKLRTLSALFPKDWQVSDDDSVLNRGAEYFVIVQPDALPSTRADGRDLTYNWVVILDLYVRYHTRAESLARFKAARSAVINLLTPNSLNDTSNISRTVVTASGGLQQDIPGDNPNFIIQTLTATITQRVRF